MKYKEIITFQVGVDVLGFPIYHTHTLTFNEKTNVKSFINTSKRYNNRLPKCGTQRQLYYRTHRPKRFHTQKPD